MKPFPRSVLVMHQLELTSHCDLRCVYCALEDQLVQTYDGSKLAKDIQPGDVVFGADGTPRLVSKATPHDEEGGCLEIKPYLLGRVRVSGGHLFQTPRGFVAASELRPDEDEIFVPRPKLAAAFSDVDLSIWDRHEYLRNPCPAKVQMTADLAWFLGIYTAEGCAGHATERDSLGMIQIVLHEKEVAFGERIRRVVKEVFGLDAAVKHYESQGRTLRITIGSARLGSFLYHVCGGAGPDMRVPFEYVSGKFAAAYLHGLFQGDGTESLRANKHRQRGLSSSTPRLVQDVVTLLLSAGIIPTVTESKEPRIGNIDGREIRSTCPEFNVRVNGARCERLDEMFRTEQMPADLSLLSSRGKQFRVDEKADGFWVRIRTADPIVEKRVIGIEVDQDHTYVVGHLVSHNCPSKDIQDGKYKANGGRDARHMTRAHFLRALEWAVWGMYNRPNPELNLAGTGESTIHPEFIDFVQIARKTIGWKPVLTLPTNGISMTAEKARVLAECKVEVFVSLHQPARAAKGVQLLKEAGCLFGVSHDAALNPIDWAGQVEWDPGGKAANQGNLCPWLEEQRVIALSDGRISVCSLDGTGEGVIGHVDDAIGSLKTAPYKHCKNCHQAVSVSGGWNQKEGVPE